MDKIPMFQLSLYFVLCNLLTWFPFRNPWKLSYFITKFAGVKRDSVCQNNVEAEAILLISAMPGEISTSQLSDDDFSEVIKLMLSTLSNHSYEHGGL